jgi:thioredoxin
LKQQPQHDLAVVQEKRKSNPTNIYDPSPAISTTTTTTILDDDIVTKKLTELRSMSLIELKLQCSRRNITYYKFTTQEEFVQAIFDDMKGALSFSVTGLVRPGMVAEITGPQLDEELTSQDSMILVDVYATWCGPCKMLVPQLEGASKQLNDAVRVFKLDSVKHPDWAARYHVQALPTMLLIKDGRVVDRLEGAHMTDVIVDFVHNNR